MVEILKGCGPGVFRCGPHGSAAGTYLNFPGGNRRPHNQISRLVVSARLEIKYCFHSIFGFSPPHSTAFTDDLLALPPSLVAAQPGARVPAPSRAGREAPRPERASLAGNSAGVVRGLPRLRVAKSPGEELAAAGARRRGRHLPRRFRAAHSERMRPNRA